MTPNQNPTVETITSHTSPDGDIEFRAKLVSSSATGHKTKSIVCKGSNVSEAEHYAAGECAAWENRLAAKSSAPTDDTDTDADD